MPASHLRESALNAPNAPLEQPPKAYWPAEEHHQRLLLVISIFLFLFFLFNFSAYLNERKRKRMAELEYREEAENEQEIEKSKAKVVAWMELTETEPPSPIDINLPKYQSLVPTSAQPEYGNRRVQRPKSYRSKTEPLLHRSSRDSELELLYRTFDDPSHGSKPIKNSNGPATSEPSSWSTVASENTHINPPVLAPSKTLVDKVPAPKKVSFAFNDEVIASSWSTIVSGISMKGQLATPKKKFAFGVNDEESAGSWSTFSSDESMEV